MSSGKETDSIATAKQMEIPVKYGLGLTKDSEGKSVFWIQRTAVRQPTQFREYVPEWK